MHLRVTRVRRGNKTYEYAQLVQSFHRPGKSPGQKVIQKLGRLSPAQIANWRALLDANRKGRPLVVSDDTRTEPSEKPRANLQYLDIAVLHEAWKRWGLNQVFEELMPTRDGIVPPASVIEALVIQRCVKPNPKSYAVNWFPRTALPELLGVEPANFNNTRLHRVLEELDSIQVSLMRRLPDLYLYGGLEQINRSNRTKQREFVAMFLDVTDAWFVGKGGSVAEKAKTKEGRFERKINIALVCNEHGYPIRWEVCPGREHDSKMMLRFFNKLGQFDWVGKSPVVCDRAMGCTAHLRTISRSGVRFLTALTRNEFGSYAHTLPGEKLMDFKPMKGELPNKVDVCKAAQMIEEAGMHKVDDDLYVLDLGTVIYAGDLDEQPTDSEHLDEDAPGVDADKTTKAMWYGQRAHEAINDGRAASYRAAGALFGLHKYQVSEYVKLVNLSEDLQQKVLDGGAKGLSVASLVRVANLKEPRKQREELERLIEKAISKPDRRQTREATTNKSKNTPPPSHRDEQPLEVRAVVYFNPELFVQMRITARRTRESIDGFVEGLNKSLASPKSKRKPNQIYAEVYAKLKRYDAVDAFDIAITSRKINGRDRYQVVLTLNENNWNRRRRLDGFSMLVGHPELEQDAATLSRLYRQKDVVETDFKVIKGALELRPFHHRTDHKIRAHVTICMLALLLDRTINQRLKAVGSKYRSNYAFDLLEDCRLNLFDAAAALPARYSITHANEKQNEILRALRLKHLTDDQELADQITPR